MHPSAFEFVRRCAWSLPPLRRVAEFGSREFNGSVREIFQDALRPGGVYVGVDLAPGPGVDAVADAASWEWFGEPFDCVVCCEVFEHTPDVVAICRNARHHLRRGGAFIVTCASRRRPEHGSDGGPLRGGEFYRGLSPKVLLACLAAADFGLVLFDPAAPRGDLYALAFRHR